MTLFEFIDLAAELPLDAVELTSYYFAETSDAYIEKLKAHAAKKKLAISGVPVGNNFCRRDEAKYKDEVKLVKDWTERAAKLGAQTVRIFAGTQEKGDTLEEAQKRVVAALEECCPLAEKLGVMLALENHGGITDTPEHLLDLVKPVKSKALGVNIDTGNFHTADPYADIAKIAPYGVVAQVKTEVSPGGKKQERGPRESGEDSQGRQLPRLRRARIRGRGRPEGGGAAVRQGTAKADWMRDQTGTRMTRIRARG